VTIVQPSLAEWLKVDRDKVRDLWTSWLMAHTRTARADGHADVAEGDLVCGLLRLSENPDVKQGDWWST